MWKEFKEFALKGNMLDLAVGIIIGGAFSTIVSSLVKDIIMPIFALLTSGVNFTQMAFISANGGVIITYGNFIQNVVNFLIIAFSLFLVIKLINKVRKKEEASTPGTSPQPSEQQLLAEIRDLLKAQQSK